MNIITLMGRLARDPEIRTTDSGKTVAHYTLAVDRPRTDAVDFIRCVAWEKGAEFARSYLHKGMKVALTGSLHINTHNDKQYAEVVVDHVYFCESKQQPANEYEELVDETELPF